MYAYAYEKAHSLEDFNIKEITLDVPEPGPDDVLVRIKCSAFNPVDTKVRSIKDGSVEQPLILGWDASGIIEKTGYNVKDFSAGDEVFYAGDLTRPGSYGEFQLVDYRLIARKPASLTFAEAAALPLTSLTAWEALFERGFDYSEETKVLIIGGAGGVGSMAIQLLKASSPATVIATASRKETVRWCSDMGADHVIGRDIKSELENLGIRQVDIVFSTTHTSDYVDTIREILRPFGHLVLIDSPATLDIASFKTKALSVHWEYMFAKSLFHHHREEQGEFLKLLAELADERNIKSTLHKILPNSIQSVREAHELLESGKSLGKIVMKWQD